MTGSVNDIFVDTNVLVHAAVTSASLHNHAYAMLQGLRLRNVPLWISRQVVREYLAVMTRSQLFGQPLASAVAAQDARRLAQQYHIANDDTMTAALLLQLIERVLL